MYKYILGDDKIVIYTGEKLTSDELKIVEENPKLFTDLVKKDPKMIELPCNTEKEAENIINNMANKNN